MEYSYAVAVLDCSFGRLTVHRMGILAGALLIAAQVLVPRCGLASEPREPEQHTDLQTVLETGSIAQWLKVQFSAAELRQLRVGDVQVDAHYCGCFDEPVKHYPYSVVVIRTTRGDLVMRPENVEVQCDSRPWLSGMGTDTARLIRVVATACFLRSAISPTSDTDLI
jgi:hypothetical protein